MRWAMAIFYFVAGILHLRRLEVFLPIMPDWVPAPPEVILFTGACEIVGAVALVTRSMVGRSNARLMRCWRLSSERQVRRLQRSGTGYRRVGGTMCLGWLFSLSSYGGRSILRRSSAGPSVAARNALPARAARTSVRRRDISDPLAGLAMFSPNKRDERFCASTGIRCWAMGREPGSPGRICIQPSGLPVGELAESVGA